jgi:DNA helicase II / ATP-dependent DNA helicase PcrA
MPSSGAARSHPRLAFLVSTRAPSLYNQRVEMTDTFTTTQPAAGPVSASASADRFSAPALARELNPPQVEAVLYPPKPLLVVAGAGSGKTRVITYRLAHMLMSGASAHRVLVVTFTNKAARELKERVEKLFGGHGLHGMWIGTFHGICARLLRRFGEAVGLRKEFVIYDDDDSRRLMSRVLADMNVPEKNFPVRQVLSIIDQAKNRGQTADRFPSGDYFDEVVGKAYRTYEERLRAANAVDFGGLLLSTLALCKVDCPAAPELSMLFDNVLVDEFQDTNNVQYRLVRFLSQRTGSITVVGDEDQSIYRWRGADIRNILDFETDHPGAAVVKLEQNYRSTSNILRTANAVIARNKERRPKRLITEQAAGAPVVVFEGDSEREEAEFLSGIIAGDLAKDAAPRDFAIFYRTNAQSRVLEEALRARNVPYTVVGGTRFYDRAEIKDLICYLRVLQNPDDSVGLQRIINVPTRGIGNTTIDRLLTVANEKNISLMAALDVAVEDPAILGQAARRKVAEFAALLGRLRASMHLPPAELAEKVLEESGYRDFLAADTSMESEGRLENLLELVGQMRDYQRETEEPTLSGFLERITLASDQDSFDAEKGTVSLMTVHTAKGLEFDIVFVTGMEEGIFPHQRSIDDDGAMEEERRLCYVAVTRARKRLYLCRARWRRLSGQTFGGVPSRFLRDLPPDGIEHLVTPQRNYQDVQTEGAGPWQGRWNRDSAKPRSSFAQPVAKSSPASSMPGEITRHYDEGAAPGGAGEGELGLRVGVKVRHASFGVGEVRAWQSSGADLKVTVRFASVGAKTVLARFLSKP